MLLALVLPLALLSACGDDSGSTATDPVTSPSPSSSAPASPSGPASLSDSPTDVTTGPADPPDWPACESIWKEGARIPASYKGCLEGSNAVASDNLSCSSGQRIVRYQDRFYGVAGGTIHQTSGPLLKDKEYLQAIGRCRA
jgi:hypothetical protein